MEMTTTSINHVEMGLLNDEENSTNFCAENLMNGLLEGKSGRILWGIVQILLMFLGNLGNFLTLIVLNHRLMRKCAVNNLLQGLAISDIVAPSLASIPQIIFYYGLRVNGKIIHLINVYLIPIATGATFCSNWIVVTITIFRLMIVIKPLYSQIYCSSRNEKRALISIFLLGICSISPYYFYQTDANAQNILRVITAIISSLVPWLICLILWIILIRIVNREIGRKNSQNFILNSEIIAQRLKSKSKITRMVLILCFCNIFCQLPVLILTVFGLINGNPCGKISSIVFVVLLFISNILLTVNHSIHFFIYSLTNEKFRYVLKVMSCRCAILTGSSTRLTNRTMGTHSKTHFSTHVALRIHLKDKTKTKFCRNQRTFV